MPTLISTVLALLLAGPPTDVQIVGAYWADARGLDRATFLAVACVESRFDRAAVGPNGERGPWQVWPYTLGIRWTYERPTGDELQRSLSLNAEWASRILAEALDRAEGDLYLALRYYNGTWATGNEGAAAWYWREFRKCRDRLANSTW